MHFPEDTEQEDSVGEIFWNEDFKKILREELPNTIYSEMVGDSGFQCIYESEYSELFSNYEAFILSISSIIEIGCENGADIAFDDIYLAFRNHSALRMTPRYYRYFRPQIPPAEMLEEVKDAVIAEYSNEKSYLADYDDFYCQLYPTFSAFLKQVAELVVTGVVNGADDMVCRIYRCFVLKAPLPAARRRPKRLKGW